MPDLRKLPDPPVTLWVQPGDTCAGIRSALGTVNGVLPVNMVDGHCAGRAECAVLESHPGRLVMLSCAMLRQLKRSGRARVCVDDAEVRVSLTIDHICTGESRTLEFLMLPVCWRDRPDHIDPDLMVGVYLNPPSAAR